MKTQLNEIKRMQQLAGVITENKSDQIEANADLFINNEALKQYVTSNDEYGFSIMEVPVNELEKALNKTIDDIMAMDQGMLSISLDLKTNTVDIVLDRTNY